MVLGGGLTLIFGSWFSLLIWFYKRRRDFFLGFPLRGFFPWLGAYFLCQFCLLFMLLIIVWWKNLIKNNKKLTKFHKQLSRISRIVQITVLLDSLTLHPITTIIHGSFYTTIVIAFGKLAKSLRGVVNAININDSTSWLSAFFSIWIWKITKYKWAFLLHVFLSHHYWKKVYDVNFVFSILSCIYGWSILWNSIIIYEFSVERFRYNWTMEDCILTMSRLST